LRILRISDGSLPASPEYRSFIGKGGHRIEATRNLWEGSGLKVESAATGVAWGRGRMIYFILFCTRELTQGQSPVTRYLPVPGMANSSCGISAGLDLPNSVCLVVSGSASADVPFRTTNKRPYSFNKPTSHFLLGASLLRYRLCRWRFANMGMVAKNFLYQYSNKEQDLRDMSRSLMRVHHPASVRSVAFSPSLWQPLQAIVGLDNGSIYRYSLFITIRPVPTSKC
jgi:hypothetical protein